MTSATGMYAPPTAAELAMQPPSLAHAPGTCLNCGTALAGPYCHSCGQRDIPPYPSTRELVVDAFWELSGWDGRFVKTVRALVQHPGKLTCEFLEGRRASFLSPLRLYLLASLVYFVLAAGAPTIGMAGRELSTISVGTTHTTETGPDRVARAARASLDSRDPLTPAQRAKALADIERAPALLRPMLRKAIGDRAGFKRSLTEAMPRMLFALLPIFAGLVALFYRGRKYPEHLYFAIHLNAFLFLALGVVELAKYTTLSGVVAACAAIAFVWIPIYATLAFRRVYGGSIAATVAKEIAIGILYGIISTAALLITVFVVSVAS